MPKGRGARAISNSIKNPAMRIQKSMTVKDTAGGSHDWNNHNQGNQEGRDGYALPNVHNNNFVNQERATTGSLALK